MAERVIILGGGIAGLTAAHELGERGFEVEVFEKRPIPGGKARSIPARDPVRDGPLGGLVPGTARVGHRPLLPGEHGFRFFPGFYTHVIDTMARIPFRGGAVADGLVDTSRVRVARAFQPSVYYPDRLPQSALELAQLVRFVVGVLGAEMGVSAVDTAFFAEKIFQILSSCDARKRAEYEYIGWWKFIDAEARSEAYQSFFGDSFTRSVVAAKAARANTRTIGNVSAALILAALTPPKTADRVLDGPTNDVWIDPWLAHLRRLGVRYHLDAEIVGIEYHRGAIRSATVRSEGRVSRVEGDHFVAALPVERLATLLTEPMIAADPALGRLSELSEYTEWMNGIQFYLTEDRPLVHGHTVYMDSPWALTSVSQAQFWPRIDFSKYGNGGVRGIISVCVSDWDVPGSNGKRADECTRDEIMAEVWKQLKDSLNVGGEVLLRDDMLHHWFLDPAIEDSDPDRAGIESNAEPLLVNYVDTWRLRPEAASAIPNLFLASDYVRTTTDIATMEAANEAARRAVNGILAASRSGAEPCRLWNPYEPALFAPWRAYDQARFDAGLSWDAPLDREAHAALEAAEVAEVAEVADVWRRLMPGPLRILSE